MTRVFEDDGTSVPVTVIEAGPCVITRVKTSMNPNEGGSGGDQYDPIDPPFIPVKRPDISPPPNWGGAGGGGGGGEDDNPGGGEGDGIAGGQDEGGGGGGGGGGGLLVVSYETVTVVGRLLANGGGGIDQERRLVLRNRLVQAVRRRVAAPEAVVGGDVVGLKVPEIDVHLQTPVVEKPKAPKGV